MRGWVEKIPGRVRKGGSARALRAGTKAPDKWRVRYEDPTNPGKRLSAEQTFTRKGDADKELRRILEEIDHGRHIHPRSRGVTFNQWAETWWLTTASLQPNTRRGYWRKLEKHIRPYFGHWHLADISFTDIKVFIAKKQEEKLSPKYIQAMLTVISAIMECAINSGPQAPRHDNPARGHGLKVPRKRIRQGDMLTMAQAELFVSQVTEWYRPAVWLALWTGIRPAELWGFHVGDVDFDRCLIHVDRTYSPIPAYDERPRQMVEGPVKADGNRTIPIPAWLRDDLVAMLKTRQPADSLPSVWRRPGDWLFLNQHGHPVNRDTFQCKIMRPAIRRALQKDPEFPETFRRAYDMRHSHVTMLIDAGANILAIAERHGHDPAVSLRVYGHLVKGAQEELTERLMARHEEAQTARLAKVVPFQGRRPKASGQG
jgi:integrase